DAMVATELESDLIEESIDALHDRDCQNLRTLGRHNADYAIFGTSKEESVMRAIRNGPWDGGIPLERSEREAEAGQEEETAQWYDELDTCDVHAINKNGVMESAHAQGRAAPFMAKYVHRRAGSSSHIHLSLWKAGKPAFGDEKDPHGMSALM